MLINVLFLFFVPSVVSVSFPHLKGRHKGDIREDEGRTIRKYTGGLRFFFMVCADFDVVGVLSGRRIPGAGAGLCRR